MESNILLGLDSDEDFLQEAIRFAVLEKDIADLEEGTATRVGPRG